MFEQTFRYNPAIAYGQFHRYVWKFSRAHRENTAALVRVMRQNGIRTLSTGTNFQIEGKLVGRLHCGYTELLVYIFGEGFMVKFIGVPDKRWVYGTWQWQYGDVTFWLKTEDGYSNLERVLSLQWNDFYQPDRLPNRWSIHRVVVSPEEKRRRVRALAVMMCAHPRLGAESSLGALLHADALRRIADMVMMTADD